MDLFDYMRENTMEKESPLASIMKKALHILKKIFRRY